MRTIHKFDLAPLHDTVEIDMPAGSSPLTVQVQHDAPRLWAMVEDDPDGPRETRRLRIAGTGHPLGPVGPHLGTFQLGDGVLVFHVFDLGPVAA